MSRYIDAEQLITEMEISIGNIYDHDVIKGIKIGIDLINSRPTADVVEVVHGEWLPDYETFVDEWERESEPIQTGWVCSLCGRQEFQQEPYCNCGAKMGEKVE